MKNKIINAAICDARNVNEDSLSGFDNITINAAVLIVGEHSKELLNKYPVTMNVANVLEIPDGQNIILKTINGKDEIGPDSEANGTFLMVNGKLTVADGSCDALKSYFRIMVNGKVLMPKSYKGQFSNIKVNGKTEYYPDGAGILKADTEIDDLFVSRATNCLYYCSENLYFLNAQIDVEKLRSKAIRFAAKKVIIAKSLLNKLISLFDEEAEIICVPDGTRLINDDTELTPKTIKKYGTKLCVSGDVLIQNAEALSALEYLFADGKVSVNKDLEEAFDKIESVYEELKVINTDLAYITDCPTVKVGNDILSKYPKGVQIEDCAKVTLSEDLSPEDIMDKLNILDCALVLCTKEQEEAVSMIAKNVAMIRVFGQDQNDEEDIMAKDTQVINAAEYVM